MDGKSHKDLTLVQIVNSKDASVDEKSVIVSECFSQYSLVKGLRKFGVKAEDSVMSELKKLHLRNYFLPVLVNAIPLRERKHVMEFHMFLKHKREDSMKGRIVSGVDRQRPYVDKYDVSPPTTTTESVFLLATMFASENRKVAMADIPNSFPQTDMPKYQKYVYVRLRGELAKRLVEISPEFYDKYLLVNEKIRMMLYLKLKNVLYGIMKSALYFYHKLRGDLDSQGFIVNPYDPYVTNKNVNGSQLTVLWNIDDILMAHKSWKVVDDMIKFLQK